MRSCTRPRPRPLSYHPPTSRGLAVAGQNAWQALVEAAVADHASLLDVRKVVGSLAVSTFGGDGQRQGGKSLGQQRHVQLTVVRRGCGGLRHLIVYWSDMGREKNTHTRMN